MSAGSDRLGAARGPLKRAVIAGTRIYLTLVVVQFLLGLLFGAGLVLLGFDLASVEELIRGFAERWIPAAG